MELTKLEKELLRAIGNEHEGWKSIAELDLTRISVGKRECTGVGSYVTFDRENQLPLSLGVSMDLGFGGDIVVPRVDGGLGAVLAIQDGQLDYIEFFTYGDDEWDGDTSKGHLSPSRGISR